MLCFFGRVLVEYTDDGSRGWATWTGTEWEDLEAVPVQSVADRKLLAALENRPRRKSSAKPLAAVRLVLDSPARAADPADPAKGLAGAPTETDCGAGVAPLQNLDAHAPVPFPELSPSLSTDEIFFTGAYSGSSHPVKDRIVVNDVVVG